MVGDGGENQGKIDSFTSEGESIGYISLDQARVLAVEHASSNTDFYGSRYAGRTLVWEVIRQEEHEDYYDVRLSFRPAGRFRGEPGVEQFTIDKNGAIRLRQLLDEPSRYASRTRKDSRAGLWLVLFLLASAGIAAGVLYLLGVSVDDVKDAFHEAKQELSGGDKAAAAIPQIVKSGADEYDKYVGVLQWDRTARVFIGVKNNGASGYVEASATVWWPGERGVRKSEKVYLRPGEYIDVTLEFQELGAGVKWSYDVDARAVD